MILFLKKSSSQGYGALWYEIARGLAQVFL